MSRIGGPILPLPVSYIRVLIVKITTTRRDNFVTTTRLAMFKKSFTSFNVQELTIHSLPMIVNKKLSIHYYILHFLVQSVSQSKIFTVSEYTSLEVKIPNTCIPLIAKSYSFRVLALNIEI